MTPTLTELEGSVLALIGGDTPVTGYALTRMTAESPSEYWSGSAGAVYPLVKRMAERGLVLAEFGNQGKRPRTSYSLTKSGRSALKRWLLDSQRAAGLGFDPAAHTGRPSGPMHPSRSPSALREVRQRMVQALAEPAARTRRPPAGPVRGRAWRTACAR